MAMPDAAASVRKAAAAMAFCSALLHLAMVGQSDGAAGVVPAVMAVVCLVCAAELWRSGSVRSWLSVAVMGLAMVAAHWSLPGCGHSGAAPADELSSPSALAVAATVLALVESVVAAAVLIRHTQRRAATLVYHVESTQAGAPYLGPRIDHPYEERTLVAHGRHNDTQPG